MTSKINYYKFQSHSMEMLIDTPFGRRSSILEPPKRETQIKYLTFDQFLLYTFIYIYIYLYIRVYVVNHI